ncbi:hypothetical protein HMPREF1544_03584 [Mucor circinelloides 1006PhL]|uniref:Uncharacterized protein n=1 Tax=Mucor circinelloides f. circinelloides (strain 1006PhL) TaxID=1220926 RepID=S2JMA4_MUCC1|nr:hypothetical protein HMPREF1544_03584 [Mucor circinelloides 1006PhL]
MITDPVLKNKMILIHGAMMAFVWLIAVPGAILLSMYARKKRKSWGPKVHMLIMASAAFIPYTVSAILAFTVAGQIKPKPHSSIGTVLSFGLWCQVALGVVNHLVFRYRLKNNCLPAKRPWNNYVHIWFGSLLSVLALINIPLGMMIKRAPLSFFIVYAVWITILAGVYLYLTWMKEETQAPIEHKTHPEDIKIIDETNK